MNTKRVLFELSKSALAGVLMGAAIAMWFRPQLDTLFRWIDPPRCSQHDCRMIEVSSPELDSGDIKIRIGMKFKGETHYFQCPHGDSVSVTN